MHVSTSSSMSMPRWYFNQFIAAALAVASNMGVTLRYKGFKGLLRTSVTLYVEGEKAAVTKFGEWLDDFVQLNS